MSDRLVDWVRVQLDATEAAAKAAADAVGPDWFCGDEEFAVWSNPDAPTPVAVGPWGEDLGESAEHIALNDPAAVLADVEAKRATLERCEHEMRNYIGTGAQAATPYLVVRLLAEGFRGRPGYEEAISGE